MEPTRGRPRLWQDAAAFSEATDAYFDQLAGRPPTMAGLCRHLGFADKQSFGNYEDYGEDFSLTVQKARLRIEEDRNERLLTKFTPGVIFDLKNNHGWKDKIETEHSGALEVTTGAKDKLAHLLAGHAAS
jgi:hypothetical protein